MLDGLEFVRDDIAGASRGVGSVDERGHATHRLVDAAPGDEVAHDCLDALVAETERIELGVHERTEARARFRGEQPRDDSRADGAGGARDEDHRVRSSPASAIA